MAENKYQLRNDAVQQIMNKPPHVFITWGNTAILLILGILFFSLNRFKIHEKATIPIRIGALARDSAHSDKIDLVLLSNTPIPKRIKEGQLANLSVFSTTRQSVTEGKIARLTTGQYDAPVIYFITQDLQYQGQPGMIGTLQISIADKSLLSMLLDKLRL